MSRETDRLIADRGHGLSGPQRDAIRWLATDRRRGGPPKSWRTWKALERLGVVERDARYHPVLTMDGRCLAARMGLLPGTGRELDPGDRAECAEEAAWKRHTDH